MIDADEVFGQAVLAAEVALLLKNKMLEQSGTTDNDALDKFVVKKVSVMDKKELQVFKKVLSI